MGIASIISEIKKEIGESVTLVAVTKKQSIDKLLEAYQAGQRVFGENYVQELVDKAEQLPKDISWHMIGHLQTNKVKYIAPFVQLIHSVDSLKLLQEIDKQAVKNERMIECLLQVYIAEEDSKTGLEIEDLEATLEAAKSLAHVKVVGLMGMSTFTENEAQIAKEYQKLSTLYEQYKTVYHLSILSMGMSGDWPLAISCGSNMIRVGSSIFGSRL